MQELRTTPPDGDEPPGREPRDVVVTGGGAVALGCSWCRARVTSRAAAIAISGEHEHACQNPHCYHYVIGCFVAAGVPTLEHTWFPGYTWQVQSCAACELLLGWRFQGGEGGFFGLILRHLIEIDDTNG